MGGVVLCTWCAVEDHAPTAIWWLVRLFRREPVPIPTCSYSFGSHAKVGNPSWRWRRTFCFLFPWTEHLFLPTWSVQYLCSGASNWKPAYRGNIFDFRDQESKLRWAVIACGSLACNGVFEPCLLELLGIPLCRFGQAGSSCASGLLGAAGSGLGAGRLLIPTASQRLL